MVPTNLLHSLIVVNVSSPLKTRKDDFRSVDLDLLSFNATPGDRLWYLHVAKRLTRIGPIVIGDPAQVKIVEAVVPGIASISRHALDVRCHSSDCTYGSSGHCQ